MLLNSTIWIKMLTEADYLVLLGKIKHILFDSIDKYRYKSKREKNEVVNASKSRK